MVKQSSRSQEEEVLIGEREVAKALNEHGVARALGDSALAGGVVGLLLAGAAFVAARFARARRQ